MPTVKIVDLASKEVGEIELNDMGKGKGAPEYWVAVVKPGRILYEIEGVDEKTAREAMKLASQKLPVKTKFVTRAEQEGGAI